MTYRKVSFACGCQRCAGWHFEGAGDAFGSEAGRPVVVMAHGFGGTMDSGLAPFAEKFSAAGLDVLTFDYRGFGHSEGMPRQRILIDRQLDDFRAAIGAAARMPGVDPARVVLWGPSLSGAHVLRVAAERTDVAAVIAMTPMTSALAAGRAALAEGAVGAALRATARGVRSRVDVRRGQAPRYIPIVAGPGRMGALTLDGARESYLSIAGPTWRNEVDAAVGLEFGRVRTAGYAKKLDVPVLVQIADDDRHVPAHSASDTAVAARAQIHHYPCDHFDVWPGHAWFDKASDDQVRFLVNVLRARRAPTEQPLVARPAGEAHER